MAKSGRNLWTKKVAGQTVPSGGGKWTAEDLNQKISEINRLKHSTLSEKKEKILSAKEENSQNKIAEEKRLNRNAKLREQYQNEKIERKEHSISGQKFVGKILGIDPSLRGTGLALIDARADGTLVYVESQTIKNPPQMTMAECLAKIYSQTSAMIARNNPACVSIEQSVYVQNFKTAMILGSSRGAAIAAAACANLQVFEYPPLRIKQAVIGYGRASKEQIAKSVAAMVRGAPVLPLDEADAAGAALTHIFTHKI